jgi:branched-chain amino acid transport system permease protein
MSQFFINVILSSAVYLLIAQSFSQMYYATKFFNLAHATIITIAAYFVYLFSKQLSLNLFFTVVLAVTITIIIGVSTWELIFNSLFRRSNNSFLLLIASLGLYIVLQNIISIIWGDESKSLHFSDISTGYVIFSGYITGVQIVTIIVSLSLFIATHLFQKKTRIGLIIRAVSSNNELSNIFGINSNKAILWTFVMGSALAAVAGILVAFDTDMMPTMGFNLLLSGIVVMIIGGVGSTWGLIGGSFILATAQHLGAYYIDSKWMDAIAYFILILFLIWKPLGFSGKLLKKTQI